MSDKNAVKAKLARLMAEEPDAQLVVLASQISCDYDSCYESVYDVYAADVLVPSDLEQRGAWLHGLEIGTWGLDCERYYSDMDDAAEDVACFLWDAGCGDGGSSEVDQAAWNKAYEPIARMIVDDMPKHRCIVIRTD